MVAQITDGTAFDKHGRPYRRRKPRPLLYFLTACFLLTAVVWAVAFSRPADTHEVAVCNLPPPPSAPDQPRLGTSVTRTGMVGVTPAKLAETKIRVLNASGRAGQAADVADALRDLGFAQPTAVNDPVYGTTQLDCQGQIRFGMSGRDAAAALWLAAPCTELFRDDRGDDSVDLAIGTDFTALAHSNDIDTALASLRPDASGLVDPALLTKIHAGTC